MFGVAGALRARLEAQLKVRPERKARKPMRSLAVLLLVVGIMGLAVVPATIPGAAGDDIKWQHVVERTWLWGAITGAVAGAGATLLVLSFLKSKRED